MNIYNPINFAQVLVVDDFENQEALRKRKAYIERQVNTGLYERLTTYQRDNLNNSLWKNIVLNSQKIIALVQDAYRKHQDDAYIIFQLEQVLGRVEYLFDERKNSIEDTYQDTLSHLEALSAQLSGHKSNIMRYLGISLMVLGIVAMVALILLASLPTFGGTFVAALTGAGLLNISTSIGAVFGFSGTAAGIAGATIVGEAAGAIFVGSGLLTFYRGRQKGLSLAASALVNTISNIEVTLEYFDKCISSKLYEEDYLKLRDELKRLLNNGFDPIVLKKALEWANDRQNQIDLSNCEDYEAFFKRIADICCESLNNNYWIQDERVSKECWPESSAQNSNQLKNVNNDRKNFFTFYVSHTSSTSTLKYFNNFIVLGLSNEDRELLQEGLQRLMSCGFNPSTLKSALEWARARYNNAQDLYPAQPENYNDFFARLADICGVVLQAPHFLDSGAHFTIL